MPKLSDAGADYRFHRFKHKGKTRRLASVSIPNRLHTGDFIRLEFPVVLSDGRVLDGRPSKAGGRLKGGGFLRLDRNGRMQFDGT